MTSLYFSQSKKVFPWNLKMAKGPLQALGSGAGALRSVCIGRDPWTAVSLSCRFRAHLGSWWRSVQLLEHLCQMTLVAEF